MSPQQVVTQYNDLHLDPASDQSAIPSNQWWTDLLVAEPILPASGRWPTASFSKILRWAALGLPRPTRPKLSRIQFVLPQCLNTRSDTNVPEGGFNPGPALPITGSIRAAVGTNDILVADFNGTNYPPGWVTTGTAFGHGTDHRRFVAGRITARAGIRSALPA